MKKIVLAAASAMALLVTGLAVYFHLNPVGQQPDGTFDAHVEHPAYTTDHPRVLVDEGHHNAHTAQGGYAPFARLMRSDGYRVERGRGVLSEDALAGTSVLVIVDAAGGSNPKLFGFNLPFLRRGERGAPAFSTAEIETVRDWVRGGGGLLLVADHTPFGAAAASLGEAFGVTMGKGFTEAPGQYPGQPEPGELEFSRANHLLGEHPITSGREPGERIRVVRTFTGQSLDAPGAAILLALPPQAVESFPNDPEPRRAGSAQGVALEYGRGRVVVLGEAAMLTAQREGSSRWGMTDPGIDNRQFALNVMHWLSRLI